MQYGIIHKGAIIHVRPASTYDYNTAIDGISISQLRKFDDLIKAGNKEFSKSDYAEIVSKTNGYYFNNPELADKVSVFAYEGAGTVADKPWGKYHPFGQFNAMMLGIENNEVIAFTMNGSTLPDDVSYRGSHKPYVAKEGVYNTKYWMHKHDTEDEYVALKVHNSYSKSH